MKRKLILSIIAAVFFLSLACQTLVSRVSTSSEEPTPQATETVAAPSASPLAGLIYSANDPNTGSSKLWQIGNDGEAYHVVNGIFSPDGKKAAYTDLSDKCIWMVDYEKMESKPISCSSSIVYNPDLYTFDEVVGWMPGQPDKLLMLFDVSTGMGGGSGYFGTLSISNGEKNVLDSQHQAFSVKLSPDGETVAYYGADYSGLYSPDAGIKTFDTQPYGINNFALSNPAWSPDGRKMAWGLMDTNGEYKKAVGVFDLESKTVKVLHPHSLALIGMDGPPLAPSPDWSPDGKWVFFFANAHDENGSDEKQTGWWFIHPEDGTEYKLDGDFASWSPDSQWVIYQKYQQDLNNYDFMAVRPDGSDVTSLAKGMRQSLWSPDGRHLIFVDEANAVWMTEIGVWQLTQIIGAVLPDGAFLFKWQTSLLTPYEQLTVLPMPTPSANSNFSCPNAPRTRLQVGDTARVAFTDGKKSLLRYAPEPGDNSIDSLPEGTEFEIIDGPICAMLPERTDAYIYWKVIIASRNNETGWLAEGDAQSYYLEPWP